MVLGIERCINGSNVISKKKFLLVVGEMSQSLKTCTAPITDRSLVPIIYMSIHIVL